MLCSAYGQFAAHNARAERILIPLLDTLQSIPVLGFLPPVMVAMVALFPTRQFGVELGSILLIFTGVQLLTLGLLAELQARTYHESQDKPTYVIREIRESTGAPATARDYHRA